MAEKNSSILGDTGGKTYYRGDEGAGGRQRPAVDHHSEYPEIQDEDLAEICAHCGMCADSCFLYLINNAIPSRCRPTRSSPPWVNRQTQGKVDNAFMHMAMETAWAKCTCCNRCGMYCPHGIDMGIMFGYLRGLLYQQGFVPWELKIGAGMHRVYRAQMDVTDEDLSKPSSGWWRSTRRIIRAWTVPVDKEGADIMYTVNAREVKHYPEDLAEAAILFHLAGESWTVPSSGLGTDQPGHVRR
jgi:Fe-S oxidoreductase